MKNYNQGMIAFEAMAKKESEARAEAHNLWRAYFAETDLKKGTQLLKQWEEAMAKAHKAMENLTQFTFGLSIKELARGKQTVAVQSEKRHNLSLNIFNYATA